MDLFHTEPCKVIRVTFNAAIFALAASVIHFSKKNYPDKTGYTVLSVFTMIFSILVAPLQICVISDLEVQMKAFKWWDLNVCKLPNWCFNLRFDELKNGILPVVNPISTFLSIGSLSFSIHYLVIGYPNEEELLKWLIGAFVLEFANLTFWIIAFFGNNESEQRIENRNTGSSEKAKTEI